MMIVFSFVFLLLIPFFCYRMHKEWTIFLWFLFLPKTISKKVFKVALFYLNDIWKNELFTDQKSLSFTWLIMHFCCLNINFQENSTKKQLNLFRWYSIYFFHLINLLVFIFQGVSFIFTLTTRRREYYAGHIYLLLLTITFLMLDLSDLLKDCSIAFQIHQTMSYNSTNIFDDEISNWTIEILFQGFLIWKIIATQFSSFFTCLCIFNGIYLRAIKYILNLNFISDDSIGLKHFWLVI